MNNTNPHYQEAITLRRIKELEAEICEIRLEQQALQAQIKFGWAAHQIAHFAEWLIARGEALRQRYDHESMHTNEPRSAALA